MTDASVVCFSADCKLEDPNTQAGRFRRPGAAPRKRRYRYKREVSGRQRPRIGRGETKDSDKAENDADKKEATTDVGNEKTEEATDKVKVMNLVLSK